MRKPAALIIAAMATLLFAAPAVLASSPKSPRALVGPHVAKYGAPYLNTPYLLGGDGRSPQVPQDCSDFVANVYRDAFKLAIPDYTVTQWQQGSASGSTASTADESEIAWRGTTRSGVRPGDLVFFHTTKERLGHVGVMISKTRVQHSGNPNQIESLSRLSTKHTFAGWVRYKAVAAFEGEPVDVPLVVTATARAKDGRMVPADGASVFIRRPGGGPEMVGRTDASGRLVHRIAVLPEKRLRLQVWAETWKRSKVVRVTMRPGMSILADLRVP